MGKGISNGTRDYKWDKRLQTGKQSIHIQREKPSPALVRLSLVRLSWVQLAAQPQTPLGSRRISRAGIAGGGLIGTPGPQAMPGGEFHHQQ